MIQSQHIVLPGFVLGIHGNWQGVCHGSWMAGPSLAKPGQDDWVNHLSGSEH
jgi:hypothetical protein